MSNVKDPYRSTLSRAKGLGSSGEGVHHWWYQRLTAVIIAPLALWFVYSLVGFASSGNTAAFTIWLSHPFNALLLIVMLGALFYHARLGLQVVVEDYIHTPKKKFFMLILLNIVFLAAGVASIMAVGTLHFNG